MSTERMFQPTDVPQAGDRHRSTGKLSPAFLVGCPGSGTTVLDTILAAHPDVRAVEEARAPWRSLPRETQATGQTTESLRTWASEHQNGAALLLDGDPSNTLRVPFLRAVFPEARFVHLVRDGRDVAQALHAANPQELLPPDSTRWRESLDGVSGYLRGALLWREMVETALSDLEGVRQLLVRYEDLLERPEETGEQVLSHLGLAQGAPQREAFAGAAEVARRLPGGEEYAQRRWRAALTNRPLEVRAANVLVADLLERLGYDPAPAELVGTGEMRLPRAALMERRRLARMLEERERRIADLERTVADLRRSNLSERDVADGATRRLAEAERRASAEIELLAAKRGKLEAHVSQLTAELAHAEHARAELVSERVGLRAEQRRVQADLNEIEAALRRTATSRSWRLGHRLARLVGILLLRRPGRDSSLDVALRRIDHARAAAEGTSDRRG
jgi:Sulfotransferase family